MTTVIPATGVTVETVLGPDTLVAAWLTYRQSMGALNTQAAQRHLMTPAEFADLASDEHVTWYLHRTAGVLDGLAAVAADLGAVPLVSPAYFAARYPAAYAQGRIHYVVFLAVAKPAQHGQVFQALAEAIRVRPAAEGGVVVLDVCDRRDGRFPAAISAIADRPAVRLDAQTFYAYEFERP